jgi:hypothetical protein
MDRKDIKLAEIKKHNPTLHSKVMTGSVSLQDAYNEVMSEIMNVKETRTKGTKSTKITFEQEIEIICKRYKPKIEDWVEPLKKEYPFTYTKIIKDT